MKIFNDLYGYGYVIKRACKLNSYYVNVENSVGYILIVFEEHRFKCEFYVNGTGNFACQKLFKCSFSQYCYLVGQLEYEYNLLDSIFYKYYGRHLCVTRSKMLM